eukprot:1344758-Pyramimonas_sp.AAC.1
MIPRDWTVSRLHREACDMTCLHREEREYNRESQEEKQEEVRGDLADRPTQPTGNATSWHSQTLRIPTGSATVSRRHREECDDSRESQ